jgi:hypothetical protein
MMRRPQRWIIDNANRELEDANLYAAVHTIVLTRVKPKRDENRDRWLRENWWRPQRMRPEMRQAVRDLTRFLVTPTTSKHRIFCWLSNPVIPDHKLVVLVRSDDYFLGLVHSRIHEVWARTQGTQLRERESGLNYNVQTSLETFPFPDTPAEHEAAIAAAAKELNERRETWLNPPEWTRTETLEFPGTVGGPWDRYIVSGSDHPLPIPDSRLPIPVLIGTVRYPRLVPHDADCAARLKDRTLTKLYNARPAWLADCHARLDAAVAAAYGWTADLTDDAILERLLALNLERAGA